MANTYILEYVGEVVDKSKYIERVKTIYNNDIHHYGLSFANLVIDAHRMGNDSRYINHSCEPNAVVQKWIVNGLTRMAIFSTRNIQENEEITMHYNFVPFDAAQKCECGSKKCRGTITINSKAKAIQKNHKANQNQKSKLSKALISESKNQLQNFSPVSSATPQKFDIKTLRGNEQNKLSKVFLEISIFDNVQCNHTLGFIAESDFSEVCHSL